MLVDLFHAFFAAFLSGGELEALRHLFSFLIDLDFLSIKLDFTNLSNEEKRALESIAYASSLGLAGPCLRQNLPSGR